MGLEIRPKAVEYVQDRIDKMRKREEGFNVAVVQTNAMKYLPNYFKKGQVRHTADTLLSFHTYLSVA